MAYQIQLRSDTQLNWGNINPTLAQGEVGIEIDTNMIKFGNGIDDWITLSYYIPAAGIAWGNITGTLSNQLDLQAALGLKANQTGLDTHTNDLTIHYPQSAISITESQISDLGTYEPAFSKNTGFNLNLGTTSGTASEGNHNHAGVYEPADATILKDVDIGVNVEAYNANIQSHISDLLKHRVINDAGTLTTELFSASKIISELSSKSNTGHTHLKIDITDFSDGDYATAAQGLLANTAIQPLDNISTLTNDSGYLTSFTETDPVFLAQKGVPNGVATLDASSKIPSSQLPALAITDTFVVVSELVMLALTAQTGDVAVRTDENKSYILQGTTASVLTDWQELLTPTDAIQSVNGQTGIVVLTTTNISEGTNLYYTDSRVSANIDVVASTTHIADGTIHFTQASISITESQISDLQTYELVFTKNTAFNKDFGTLVNTVAEGNHLHTGTYEPANTNIQAHIIDITNPHTVTKVQVGLGNVDNTTDLSKPVSTATQTALDLKADQLSLDAHTSDNTIHFTEASVDHQNILNIGTNTHTQIDTHIADGTIHRVINDGGTLTTELFSASKIISELATKEPVDATILKAADIGVTVEAYNANIQAHIIDTTNPHSVTQTQVGLGNVDNTSDLNKPISTATQTGLDGKVAKTGDTMTGDLIVNAGEYVSGHMGIGENASIPAYSILDVKGVMNTDFANPNGNGVMNVDATINVTSPIKQASAFNGKATVTGNGVLPFISGMIFQVDQQGTGAWGANPGLWGQEPAAIASRFTSQAGSAAMGNWCSNIVAGKPLFLGGTPSGTYNQFQISGVNANSNWTNTYGVYIWEQTGATVEGAGVFIKPQQTAAIIANGDGASGRFLFGAGKDASIDYDGNDLVLNPKVVGTGAVAVAGDLVFTSVGDGLPYGEIYVNNNAVATTITTANTFVQILDFNTNGLSNLTTPDHTNDHITITKTGVYDVNVAVSLDGIGSGSASYACTLFINNGVTPFNNVHSSTRLSGNSGEEQFISLHGKVSLTAGDTVEVWIKNKTNTANVIVEDCTLTLTMIGG